MSGLVSLVAIVALSVVLPSSSLAGTRPQEVLINKCCRLGEYYNATDRVCVAGGIAKWVPKIFLPGKRQLYKDLGASPPFMKFAEQQLPAGCVIPTVYEVEQVTLMGNGSLFLDQKHVLVPVADYCIDERVALVCPAVDAQMDSLQAPEKTSVVLRCCGTNFAYDKGNRTCSKLARGHELFDSRIIHSPYVELSYGFPACKEHAIAGVFDETRLQEQTGSVTTDSGKIFASGEFCLEHVRDDDRKVYVFTCSEHFQPASVPIAKQDGRLVLYSAGLLISTIFLAATLATGLLVPSQHHVLHWRCQTHYVACLLVGDLLLAITQLSGNSITGPACTMIAIMMHFFFLAAFFWLNTMCFNIWWTFRDLRPTSLEKSQEVCRLRIYEVYAWGVPLVIAGVAAILDNLPDSNDTYLRPRFGEAKCWFYGNMEMLTYFFGPIGILLFINLLLFASTARQLTCGLWKRDDVKSTTER
ncbi:AGAP009453-PA-like protein [Anopheles sinensis]|uniref:AGAP009453-PA-like protein n=1 Tax=Anopheles sinensis TaxID=74873 RepID=A0A084VPR6_ANOSI|nr:AGAP009453-PA-like protein [Anopheles sinensis]